MQSLDFYTCVPTQNNNMENRVTIFNISDAVPELVQSKVIEIVLIKVKVKMLIMIQVGKLE